MQSLAVEGFSAQQVIDQLHGKYGYRPIVKFRYDLLDMNENFKLSLDGVENGEIKMSALSDIKRTATFKIKDNANINWLSDRIQPFYMLQMPNGQWLEWSLGIFLLSSPEKIEEYNQVFRQVDAFDGLQILKDDKISYRLTFTAGTNYIDNIKQIISTTNITKVNLQQTSATLQVDREWDIGTDKLTIINNLLADINYTQLWVNEYGYYTAYQYILPVNKGIDYYYKDDSSSIIFNGGKLDLDLFSIPNYFIVAVSNPDMSAPLVSTYINSNANSPTSTVSRGRTITDYETLDYISSLDALNQYVQLLATQKSQIYGNSIFETAVMPMHSFLDVLYVQYTILGIADRYEEIEWTLPLDANGKMQHTARKAVVV